jgi:hypothetical protein
MTESSCSYIYLLQEREFVNSKANVYKVGKTRQSNLKRFNSYPKGSLILLYSECCNCDKTEKYILSMLRKKFIKRTEYGAEYFEGDSTEMKLEINKIIFNVDKKTSKESDYNKIKIKEVLKSTKESENTYYHLEYKKEPTKKRVHQEEKEYLIENIISHRGKWTDLDKMTFQIKWKGYGNEYNTHEPYQNLKETVALDNYSNKKSKR